MNFMKLKIEAIADTYKILSGVKNELYDPENLPGDEWKRGSKTNEGDLPTITSRIYNVIELPHPLNFANFTILKLGPVYSANITIQARDPKLFRGISDSLEQTFNYLPIKPWGQEAEFLKTTNDGTGHVVSKKGNSTLFSVTDGNKGLSRVIAMGLFGAAPQSFTTCENLKRDLTELENLTNNYMGVCFTHYQKETPAGKFGNVTLHFTI